LGHAERASVTRSIGASIGEVYAAYVDPELLPRWMGIKAITDLSGPLDQAGTTFTEVVFGRYRSRSEVVAAEPPIQHVMTGRNFLGLGYRWTTHFAEKDGSTDVTLDAEAILPGPLGRLFRRFLTSEGMRRRMEGRLAVFASLVETKEKT
jgi:hypothetical protein